MSIIIIINKQINQIFILLGHRYDCCYDKFCGLCISKFSRNTSMYILKYFKTNFLID